MQLCVLSLMLLHAVSTLSADDSHALSAIFAEQHVQDAALDIHRSLLVLPVERRFEELFRWVLPGNEHPTLRLNLAFAPTNPGPFDPATDSDHPPHVLASGQIVSPFLDLLSAATEVGRLDDVRRPVADWSMPRTQTESAWIDASADRFAALAMIDFAAGNLDQAEQHVERILASTFAAVREQDQIPDEDIGQRLPDDPTHNDQTTAAAANGVDSFEPSDAILLMVHQMSDSPKFREATGMLLARCDRWMKSGYEPDAKRRHVMALTNRRRAADAGIVSRDANFDESEITQWNVVSRMTAASRGAGAPEPAWSFRQGHAELVSPHDRDYLYFYMPVQGNFDLECDVAVGSWSIASLMVAGLWLGPIYTQSGFDSGVFRWQARREQFTPPLTQIRHWMHYRTTVRDGVVTTYFNGRAVQSRNVGDHHDPWLAIRSNPRDHGMVRNLRITGSPVIPEEIHISKDVGLSHWHAYFQESAGNPGDHWVIIDGVLHGQRDAPAIRLDGLSWTPSDDSADSVGWDQRLLRYHRPVREDGVITYDFLYRPGEHHVHPVLDRQVFLLSPSGVRLHQVTDGSSDRTGLSPANAFDEPNCRRGPEQLPLKVGEWNQLQLRIVGDIVTLSLNGIEVFERSLELGNGRTFGLFHFADQTEATVRNIVWRGDWSRQLPSVAAQELAAPEAAFLDANLDHLTDSFTHDFRSDGLPADRFTVIRGSPGQHLKATPVGLAASRNGTGGYQNATVAPALTLTGDFDIVVEYDRFETAADANGAGTIALLAVLNNSSQDEFYLARRHIPRGDSKVDQLLQCAIVQKFPEGERRNYFVTEPMEERSGRMRLARRGDRVYYLTAEADSPNWRIRGEQPIAADAVATDGVRLLTQIHEKGGSVSVLWKSLHIRAEQIDGRAIDGQQAELGQLNEQRDQLPGRYEHDFRTQAPSADQFYKWSIPGEWQQNENGWWISAAGAEQWTSSGAATYVRVAGDFDITVHCQPQHLATPREGGQTQVYLQLEGPDASRTQINSLFNLMPNGETVATAQIRERNKQGAFKYRSIKSVAMPTIRRLRLARRGTTVIVLAAADETEADRIIARHEFTDLPIEPRNIRFMVHTGGAGRTSQVFWQSIEIRAEEVTSATSPRDLRCPPVLPQSKRPNTKPATPPAKGYLERLLDVFKSPE